MTPCLLTNDSAAPMQVLDSLAVNHSISSSEDRTAEAALTVIAIGAVIRLLYSLILMLKCQPGAYQRPWLNVFRQERTAEGKLPDDTADNTMAKQHSTSVVTLCKDDVVIHESRMMRILN